MKKIITLSVLIFALPVIVLAQDLGNVETLIEAVGDIVNLLIPLAFAVGLLAFFYGVARYILSAADEDAKAQGRRIMIGGIIALAVMASVFGIVKFLQEAFDIDDNAQVSVPTVDIR